MLWRSVCYWQAFCDFLSHLSYNILGSYLLPENVPWPSLWPNLMETFFLNCGFFLSDDYTLYPNVNLVRTHMLKNETTFPSHIEKHSLQNARNYFRS